MCYYTQQGKSAKELTDFFNRNVDCQENLLSSEFINGFSYPNIPVIVDKRPDNISTNFTWGMIPVNRNPEFRKNTLNARVETLDQKPSFAASVNKRCLIIATAYFDWHWNDGLGKSKTKYQINAQQHDIFCLAGIYCCWKSNSGEEWNTYSIVTTAPDETMKFVHNRKAADHDERMPIMLNSNDENAWLDSRNHHLDFSYPNYKPQLIGFPV